MTLSAWADDPPALAKLRTQIKKNHCHVKLTVHFDKDQKIQDDGKSKTLPVTITVTNTSHLGVVIMDGINAIHGFTFFSLDDHDTMTQVLPPSSKPGEVHSFGGRWADLLGVGESRSYTVAVPLEIYDVRGTKFVVAMEEEGAVSGKTFVTHEAAAFSSPFSFPTVK